MAKITAILVKNNGAWADFIPGDTNVTQTLVDTANATYPLLFTDVANKNATSTSTTNFSTKIKFNPSTGTLSLANLTLTGTLNASNIVSSNPITMTSLTLNTATINGALTANSLTLTTTPLPITSGGTGLAVAPAIGQILRCVTAGTLSWQAFPITDSITSSDTTLTLSAKGGSDLNTKIETLRSDWSTNNATLNTTIAALPTKTWVSSQINASQGTIIAGLVYFTQGTTAPTTTEGKNKLWLNTANNTLNYWNTASSSWITVVGAYKA